MNNTSSLTDGQASKTVRTDLKRIQSLQVVVADLKAQIKALDLSKQLKIAETELKELSEPIFKEYGAGLHDIAGHGTFEITKKEGGETVAFSSDIKGKEEFAEIETLLRQNNLVSKAKDTYKFGTIDID